MSETQVNADEHISNLTGFDAEPESVPEGAELSGPPEIGGPDSAEEPEFRPTLRASQEEPTNGESAAPDESPDLESQLSQVTNESIGRKHEIERLRQQLRDQSENIAAMREMFLDSGKQPEQTLEEQYGEEVVNDPAMKLLLTKLNKLEEQQAESIEWRNRAIQARQQQSQAQQEVAKKVQHLKNSEEAFVKKHPDYQHAYRFMREKRAALHRARGYSDTDIVDMLNQEERDFVDECFHRNRDMATDLYAMAKAEGYSPPVDGEEEPDPGQMPSSAANADRVREGVRTRPISGGRPNTNRQSGVLTREEFMNQVPKSERMRILANEDKFEELARTGKITLR